ncbi:type II methionyl aminopeptidase [Pyrobaculum neutrophilum]|uniref:Methionine aminopeptidase n=1 Tax=Pyrobaculum neutrophilum (strain DSM 2338 / JCM 9278 / NBRC 100436 / V24Sta) TaxID=444157 RepID=B1Y920_PYRNV|nr:type II methionyl aminopeptidase [Pyrobaculum neutrophilum]ACB40249.1 methionine aminopeptidase, type II [Pyrobaculum neutrophilum V24Sta]
MLRVLRQVGDVVHRALKYAIDLAQAETPVLEICEKVEGFIRANDAKPAFPVNVSINEVAAHYTARRGDVLRLPKTGVVKIDVGAQRDGYIVDAAVTIAVGPVFSNLAKAARAALETALGAVKPGVKAWQVGESVERVIKSFGFNPIYNLTGHKIERYILHAGYVVPNYPDKTASQAFAVGDVYAVEPFATNGEGYVTDGRDITIYRLVRMRHKTHQHVIDVVSAEAGPLPFSPRWFPQLSDADIESALKAGVLQGYEVLVERSRGYVAQFEDTVYVSEDGAVPLARTLELL